MPVNKGMISPNQASLLMDHYLVVGQPQANMTEL